jgi:hypothetical protein
MDDENKVYAIVDLSGYATEIREAAANSLAENNDDNLDEYISVQQIINLVNEKCCGHDANHRPLLNENINAEIYENIIIWIHNVGLAKLAAKDLVECAWDNCSNEMIFWSKSKQKVKKEKNTNAKRTKSRDKNLGDQK